MAISSLHLYIRTKSVTSAKNGKMQMNSFQNSVNLSSFKNGLYMYRFHTLFEKIARIVSHRVQAKFCQREKIHLSVKGYQKIDYYWFEEV